MISYFGYYNWAKKEAASHFQKNIGEGNLQKEIEKWQEKNPLQAQMMVVEIWKELNIYDELKLETNPEIIKQKLMRKIGELNDNERKDFEKSLVRIYQKHAPSLLESFEDKFPWYLRYPTTIFFSIILMSSGIGFLFGYLLESEKEQIPYRY